MNEEVELLRKNWIHNLVDGGYNKCQAFLYFDGDKDGEEFCAVGVGGDVAGLDKRQFDFTIDELTIADQYKLRYDVVEYITSMNDGRIFNLDDSNFRRKPQRSFEFIARWLEIYFALERIYGNESRDSI